MRCTIADCSAWFVAKPASVSMASTSTKPPRAMPPAETDTSMRLWTSSSRNTRRCRAQGCCEAQGDDREAQGCGPQGHDEAGSREASHHQALSLADTEPSIEGPLRGSLVASAPCSSRRVTVEASVRPSFRHPLLNFRADSTGIRIASRITPATDRPAPRRPPSHARPIRV